MKPRALDADKGDDEMDGNQVGGLLYASFAFVTISFTNSVTNSLKSFFSCDSYRLLFLGFEGCFDLYAISLSGINSLRKCVCR